jgi:hypothetical protein
VIALVAYAAVCVGNPRRPSAVRSMMGGDVERLGTGMMSSAAKRFGFVPVGTYGDMVGPVVDWLATAQRTGDPTGILPAPDDSDFAHFFDYGRGEAWLSG